MLALQERQDANHQKLIDELEQTSIEQCCLKESLDAMNTEVTDTLRGLGDEMNGASSISKAGFDDLGQKLDAMTNMMGKMMQQLIEKQGEKTQLQPATAAPAQGITVKPEPAEQENRKSNASRHSTPQANPQNSPVKTEVKVTQPVEQPPVAVTPEMKSSGVAGAITNSINITGTTPMTTTTDSGNSKLPDTRLASKMDDSSTRSTAAVNNSMASTSVANIPIA